MAIGIKELYLLGYNGVLCGGWLAILVQIARHLTASSEPDFTTVYPLVRSLLLVCQSAAVMEVLHAMVGLVRSPVFTTFVQVMSRVIVLYGSLEIGSKAVTDSPIMTQMLVAWSLSEIIRYSFYFINLVNKDGVPSALKWLRYSAFMVLYPMGITGEIGCMYHAIPHATKTGIYSIALPNKYNFAFSYSGFIWFALFGMYPIGSYVMYTYMLSQRRKVLAAKPSDEKKKQ